MSEAHEEAEESQLTFGSTSMSEAHEEAAESLLKLIYGCEICHSTSSAVEHPPREIGDYLDYIYHGICKDVFHSSRYM